MAYIAPIHRPSSVRHAVKLSFLSKDGEDLIIAKGNQLEIWSSNPQTPALLVLRYTKSIYGKVTLMHKLRPATSVLDHLFVGTDKFHYFTLSWDAEKKELQTQISYVDVADKAARDSQTGDRIAIDPTSRFIALECFEGVINILPIAQTGKGKSRAADKKIGDIGDPIPVRVPELFVRSTCFLHQRESTGTRLPNPEFAILEEDAQQNLRIKVRQLDYTPSLRPQEEPALADFDKFREVDGYVEIGSSHLIPLPPPIYGFLIIGETCITYVEDQDYRLSRTKPLSEATVFVSWCAIDEQRYVLADDYGKLYLLYITQDEHGNYTDHQLDALGTTSRASTLVYLGSGRVFVGSNQGDSKLIQIVPQGLEVIQNFPNIGPVLDFTVMDMGNRSTESVVNEFSSGQARIVTGSGAYQDGSLRSVRSGVGLEDLGTIGKMDAPVTAMFGVTSVPGGPVDTLVVSFHTATRAFQFDREGAVGELFVTDTQLPWQDQETLYAGSLLNGQTVHICSASVSIGNIFTDHDSTATLSWSPSKTGASISLACTMDNDILLSVGGTELIVLRVASGGISVATTRSFDSNDQISCITASKALPGACIVGFWKSSTIALLDMKTLETVATVAASEDPVVVPRSLRVASILSDSEPTLFIGLTDGTVVTYTVVSAPARFTVKKSMIVGTQQPNFALLPRGNGQQNIFASCEHPSLIYGAEGRLVYSAVTAQDSTAVCSFDCEAYPGAIAIATGAEGLLKLAVVDEERTTHVETLPVQETVRRIAYSPSLKAFALGCIKRTLAAGVEEVRSHLKLVDEVVFKELDTYDLEPDELIECVMRCQHFDLAGSPVERFVVGTAFLDDTSKDKARGRILVFEVPETRRLELVLEQELKGACRCLAMCEGRIIAALIKTVSERDLFCGIVLTPTGYCLRTRVRCTESTHAREESSIPNSNSTNRSSRHWKCSGRHRLDEVAVIAPIQSWYGW